MFDELMVNIKTEICHNIFRSASSMMAFENFLPIMPKQTQHSQASAIGNAVAAASGGASRQCFRCGQRSVGSRGQGSTGADRSESGAQRSVSLWQRQEVQAVLRQIISKSAEWNQ